mmetsp:Transcript_26079/g.82506  ORF Transcript_26079/g.82506 Transcript_26079/m.82506 type:complete len:363 (+) Transcript_26079:111-1199(+)
MPGAETLQPPLLERREAEELFGQLDVEGRGFLGVAEVLGAFASGLLAGRPQAARAVARAAALARCRVAREEFLEAVLAPVAWPAAAGPTEASQQPDGSSAGHWRAAWLRGHEAVGADVWPGQGRGCPPRRPGSAPGRRPWHAPQPPLSERAVAAATSEACQQLPRSRPSLEAPAHAMAPRLHSSTGLEDGVSEETGAMDSIFLPCRETENWPVKDPLAGLVELHGDAPGSGVRLDEWVDGHFRCSLRSPYRGPWRTASCTPQSVSEESPPLRSCRSFQAPAVAQPCARVPTPCRPTLPRPASTPRPPFREARWEEGLRGGHCQQAWSFFDCSTEPPAPRRLSEVGRLRYAAPCRTPSSSPRG